MRSKLLGHYEKEDAKPVISTELSKKNYLRDCLFSGGYWEGETPVPIPNTEVKPLTVDGTALATGWESRSLPGVN